ncbi:MAG: plastocyanin/azurin family copper-binding protein, partial [Ferruginibacter sp.]
MKSHFLNFLASLIIPTLLNLSCSKGDSSTGGGGGGPITASVSILAMSYSPSTLTVKTGTIVTWTNNGGTAHTVTADNGTTFNSPSLSVGNTFVFTAAATGTFPYHCLI